ncbi:MAG: hypothetical protein PWQ38_63 [Proteiniphilum sp.]|jgi:hypothetical protein|nr:hypothetical protein [Proteiniphilum sp.]
MHRLGITFLLIALAAPLLTAQDSLHQGQNDSQRVAYLDSLTYRQFLDEDYRELIKTSIRAEEEGLGFYYLTYRTALAYYALKNYAKAVEYYSETLSETPDDPALKEGLYYAYLLSGQRENAAIVAKTLAPHTQATIGLKSSVVNNLSLSGGYLMNNNNPGSLSHTTGQDSLNQYQDMIFSVLGIDFNLSERSKLRLGYQLYNTRFQRSVASALIKEEHLSQHQLVAALEFFTPNNVTWGFSGGYYNIESIDNILSSPAYGNGGYGAGPGSNNPTAATNRNSAYSLLAFLNKRFIYTLPEIAVAYSNFGGIAQYQVKGSLTYYPLGNLNFYGITSAAMIHTPEGWTTEQYIFSQHLGVKLFRQIWLDANGSFGNHLNYITDRSFLVYDTYDPIKALAGLSLSWYMKKITLSTGYQWQQKEGYAYAETDYSAYKYNNHLVNITLIWNF